MTGRDRVALQLLGLVLVLASARVFDNPKMQSPLWTVPYLSGAANYQFCEGWRHDPSEIVRFRELPDRSSRESFRSVPSESTTPYTLQPSGYLYVALAARSLFFWLGDLKALESLQLLAHATLVLFALARLSGLSRFLFFVLYGINPLILYFVTFPYYYYWQTVPGALLAVYLLDERLRWGRWLLFLAPLLAGVYLIRPTTLLSSVAVFGASCLRESKVLAAVSLAAFLICAFGLFSGNSHEKDPWFAAFVAIGAYPNPELAGFGDIYGIERFEQIRGKTLGMLNVDGAYHTDSALRREFADTMRLGFLEFARKEPLLLLRNAILNFLESFSVGYVVDHLALTYLSAATGLVWLSILLWRRQFSYALLIAAAGATFTPYYPPTQAHMFGVYPLLVASVIAVTRGFGLDSASRDLEDVTR